MSKICRTFAAEFKKTMMKKMYNTPKIETTQIVSGSMMLPESPGSKYNPTPARHNVAPPVPGENL